MKGDAAAFICWSIFAALVGGMFSSCAWVPIAKFDAKKEACLNYADRKSVV